MKKSLIVYFSHRKENYVASAIKDLKIGNTEVIAKKVQAIIGAELFEIHPLHEYPSKYDECTKLAKDELETNARPKIINIISHFEEYENIYLGYPNWCSTMPMCLWTFLESYDFTNKHIYPFCTHEGSGLGKSISDLNKICPNAIIHQGLDIFGSQVFDSDEKIFKWLKEN